MDLEKYIRVIEDFPQKGVSFKDITTLLKNGKAFKDSVLKMANIIKELDVDIIVGPEARGFIFGAPVACELGIGFVPVRKIGKLPGETLKYEYQLEYGVDILEIHKDAIGKGDKVAIVDDLLATGGTIASTVEMVEMLGGEIVHLGFLIELEYLEGRKKLSKYNISSLIKY